MAGHGGWGTVGVPVDKIIVWMAYHHVSEGSTDMTNENESKILFIYCGIIFPHDTAALNVITLFTW